MTVPIEYIPNAVLHPEELFQSLWNELDWVRHDKVPRREYYYNELGVPYTYGTPPYDRTYQAQPLHKDIDYIRIAAESAAHCQLEVCFLNGYEDGQDQLGWHADNSPEMDDRKPFIIVSLGAEREIWFQDNDKTEEVTKLRLGHGSICVMKPGMQDTHKHRIPKSDRECGPRISLTFRGYVK